MYQAPHTEPPRDLAWGCLDPTGTLDVSTIRSDAEESVRSMVGAGWIEDWLRLRAEGWTCRRVGITAGRVARDPDPAIDALVRTAHALASSGRCRCAETGAEYDADCEDCPIRASEALTRAAEHLSARFAQLEGPVAATPRIAAAAEIDAIEGSQGEDFAPTPDEPVTADVARRNDQTDGAGPRPLSTFAGEAGNPDVAPPTAPPAEPPPPPPPPPAADDGAPLTPIPTVPRILSEPLSGTVPFFPPYVFVFDDPTIVDSRSRKARLYTSPRKLDKELLITISAQAATRLIIDLQASSTAPSS